MTLAEYLELLQITGDGTGSHAENALTIELFREHSEIASAYIGEPVLSFEFYRMLFVLLFFSAWVLSLAFMIYVRKDQNNVPIVN